MTETSGVELFVNAEYVLLGDKRLSADMARLLARELLDAANVSSALARSKQSDDLRRVADAADVAAMIGEP